MSETANTTAVTTKPLKKTRCFDQNWGSFDLNGRSVRPRVSKSSKTKADEKTKLGRLDLVLQKFKIGTRILKSEAFFSKPEVVLIVEAKFNGAFDIG